jgi:uncharacterized Zn-finger protein
MPEGAATPTEIISVTTDVVACDGGDGPLGHPRVFIHLVDGRAVCPYCSRLFVRKAGTKHLAGH